jgi:hypothetical protein
MGHLLDAGCGQAVSDNLSEVESEFLRAKAVGSAALLLRMLDGQVFLSCGDFLQDDEMTFAIERH